ncbi:hypothetical protein [Bacillus amyloliquefaciens]|uniref:hypothetical protein n=1 Tax=Bacillus amyloliquefaciens TaxID=1390 RepID=UPI0028096A88|nr:hypothetical protein [Bacillus amyloliquefaciens]MDQ8091152.1 hypothetical protein [Bacillus amyloliquefaciens]
MKNLTKVNLTRKKKLNSSKGLFQGDSKESIAISGAADITDSGIIMTMFVSAGDMAAEQVENSQCNGRVFCSEHCIWNFPPVSSFFGCFWQYL